MLLHVGVADGVVCKLYMLNYVLSGEWK